MRCPAHPQSETAVLAGDPRAFRESKAAFEVWLGHQHRPIPAAAWPFASASPGCIIEMLSLGQRQGVEPHTLRQLLGTFNNTVRRSKKLLPEAEGAFRKWLAEVELSVRR
jgi:hypothetical protein